MAPNHPEYSLSRCGSCLPLSTCLHRWTQRAHIPSFSFTISSTQGRHLAAGTAVQLSTKPQTGAVWGENWTLCHQQLHCSREGGGWWYCCSFSVPQTDKAIWFESIFRKVQDFDLWTCLLDTVYLKFTVSSVLLRKVEYWFPLVTTEGADVET